MLSAARIVMAIAMACTLALSGCASSQEVAPTTSAPPLPVMVSLEDVGLVHVVHPLAAEGTVRIDFVISWTPDAGGLLVLWGFGGPPTSVPAIAGASVAGWSEANQTIGVRTSQEDVQATDAGLLTFVTNPAQRESSVRGFTIVNPDRTKVYPGLGLPWSEPTVHLVIAAWGNVTDARFDVSAPGSAIVRAEQVANVTPAWERSFDATVGIDSPFLQASTGASSFTHEVPDDGWTLIYTDAGERAMHTVDPSGVEQKGQIHENVLTTDQSGRWLVHVADGASLQPPRPLALFLHTCNCGSSA